MSNGGGQFYMPQTLTPNFGLGYLNTTTITNYAPIANPLVLAAVTGPILYWSKSAFAEKPVALGFEGAIIYSFGLGYLPMRPSPNGFR